MTFLSSILYWLTAHEAVLAGLVVALIDFVFSVNSNAESNSFLEWLLAQAKALVNSAPDSLKKRNITKL